MLHAVKVKPDVYWVGGIDWNERNFHGYTTDRGSTYNAYLIMDEQVTLIDTCKPAFAGELIERISEVVDPACIEHVIVNHVEQDHSGAVPAISYLAPRAKIYASGPHGVNGLTAHYGDRGYVPVKTGDTLRIGKRTLSFTQTMMVHWPDNMATYSEYDRILFSNDAFGQHFASSARFDDENDMCEVMHQAHKYYANIVQPYRAQAAAAVKAVRGLGPDALELICPAHGIIWRSHVEDILAAYEGFVSGEVQERALAVYDSMWHSTEKIARSLVDGFLAAGVPAQLMDLKENHISNVMDVFMDCKYVCVGSPTLNSQMLPTVAGFLTYMKGLSPKNDNRVGLAFGSYGWAPMGPKNVAAELEAAGFRMPVDTLAVNWIPGDEQLDAARDAVAG